MRTQGTLRNLGRTDESGQAAFEPVAPPFELVACSPGHASASRLLIAAVVAPIELVLGMPQAIEGEVVTISGEPAPPGIRVLAIPLGKSLAFERLPIDLVQRDPEVGQAETDGRGRFRIEGLRQRERYLLIAAGKGWIRSGLQRILALPGDFARVPVARGHALWVRFVDHDNAPARLGLGVGAKGNLVASIQRGQGTLLPATLELQLALSMPELAELPRNERLFLAEATGFAEEIGPLDLTATFPGFEPFEAELSMPSLDRLRGPLSLVLNSRSTERGELEVVVQAPHVEGMEVVERARVAGLLTLVSEDGVAQQFPLTHPLSGPHVLVDVPVGRYRATLCDEPRTWRLPRSGEELFVDVTKERTQVTFALEEVGALEIEIRDLSGEPFDQEARFSILIGDSVTAASGHQLFRQAFVFFERGPYRIPMLAPGSYALRLEYPEFTTPERFEVVGGSTTHVTLQADS